MSVYIMPTCADVVRLLNEIRDEMVTLFGISEADAVARINHKWQRHDLSSENEIILHEDGYFWALVIYFGATVPEWHRDADRSSWTPVAPPPPDSPCWT